MISSKNLPPQISGKPTLEEFLTKWRRALRKRQTPERAFWEGSYAYVDLVRSGDLARVRLEDDENGDPGGPFSNEPDAPIPSHSLNKICWALKAYKRDMNRVRDLIEFQQDHQEWLYKQAKAFRSRADRAAATDPLLARDLKSVARRIDEARRGTRSTLARRWEHNLGIVAPIRGHDKVQQARQLDSQFQVRLGAILRAFMPDLPLEKDARGPSLRTIARLIVLFLVCAELAKVGGGEVRLGHNNRKVTVDGVLQQLRAGIGY